MSKSLIAWTTYSWNPRWGCTKISPGCTHCYIDRDLRRHHLSAFKGPIRTSVTTWHNPIKFQREASHLPEDWGLGYPNVWLGVSVESPDYLFRVEHLKAVPARIRFISAEPLLAAIDFDPIAQGIDWIITGCESTGPHNGEQARDANGVDSRHRPCVREIRNCSFSETVR